MKLLIDLSPIKSGGGAQLALNFIEFIRHESNLDVPLMILVSDKFPFLDRLDGIDYLITPSSTLRRLAFENITLQRLIKEKFITHIYTFFGAGLPKIQGVRQVVGVAYPIICNDDSVYWKNLPLKNYISKKIQNAFRKFRLRKADALIFETEVMRNRCTKVLNYEQNKAFIIPPTPTKFLTACQKGSEDSHTVRFLFLSGLDRHKNLWRLVEVARKLDEQYETPPCQFVISVEKQNFLNAYQQEIYRSDLNIIDHYFEFVGHVRQNEITSIYAKTDVVVNISDLESFSNNYMEAWLTKKPIFASDRDFSKSICGDSAIYVEPHDINSIVNGINQFIGGDVDTHALIAEGEKRLEQLPSLEQRLTILRSIIFQ